MPEEIALHSIPGESLRRFSALSDQVTGVVDVSGENLAIYEWNSFEPGKGNTLVVLQMFRRTYTVIHVVGIGSSPADPSWAYWQKMAARGLVDSLEDDDGNTISIGPA